MPEYSSVACLAVPAGWRVIVVSDLFLGAKRTEVSGHTSVELARALELAEGPGALVIAGNAFDGLPSDSVTVLRAGLEPTATLGVG